METKTAATWTELSKVSGGTESHPGQQYRIETAIVEKNDAGRVRVRLLDRWGSNQGYLEERGRDDRQYRADSLSELMRIAVSSEKERDNPSQKMLTAVRDAIYQAEDE